MAYLRKPIGKAQRPPPPPSPEREPVDFAALEAQTAAFLKMTEPEGNPELGPLTREEMRINEAREAVISAARQSAESMMLLKKLFTANAEGRRLDAEKTNVALFEEICGELAHRENNDIITAGFRSGLSEFFSMASNLYQAWNTQMTFIESDLKKHFRIRDNGAPLAPGYVM